MRVPSSMPRSCLLAALVTGLAMTPVPAGASSRIATPKKSCSTAPNCGHTKIRGTYLRDNGLQIPMVIQVYASTSECLRLDMVDASGSDAEMTLIAPDGTVWRDDDSHGDLLPLIQADTTNEDPGWYTLTVSHYAGTGRSDFLIKYGRYSLGAAHCPSPTAKLDAPASEEALKDAAAGDASGGRSGTASGQ